MTHEEIEAHKDIINELFEAYNTRIGEKTVFSSTAIESLEALCEAAKSNKMPSDRTPQEWAVFCAEKMMGWDHAGDPLTYRKPSGQVMSLYLWSPYENPADALEVLERLRKITEADSESWPPWGIFCEGPPDNIRWIVSIGELEDYSACAPGPHFGPAVCELAAKIVESINAKTSQL